MKSERLRERMSFLSRLRGESKKKQKENKELVPAVNKEEVVLPVGETMLSFMSGRLMSPIDVGRLMSPEDDVDDCGPIASNEVEIDSSSIPIADSAERSE